MTWEVLWPIIKAQLVYLGPELLAIVEKLYKQIFLQMQEAHKEMAKVKGGGDCPPCDPTVAGNLEAAHAAACEACCAACRTLCALHCAGAALGVELCPDGDDCGA